MKSSHFVSFVAILSALGLVVSSVNPARAGKLERTLAIGAAIGAGVYIIGKALKKHNRKRRRGKYRKARRGGSGMSKSHIRAIQAALNARGFNAGRPDGILGRGTRNAIRRFQASIGARQTGRLTRRQVGMLLGGGAAVAQAAAAGARDGCSNPMSEEQLARVVAFFREMAPGGDGFKIDRCRNITLRYGDRVKRGKLHMLFTELNQQSHDTTYFGLARKGGWDVYGGLIYIFDPNKTKQQSAEWLLKYNKNIVRLLALAGYASDPMAKVREEKLKNDLEALGRPDFWESLGNLAAFARKYQGSSSNSYDERKPLYTIIKNNVKDIRFHGDIVIRCRDGRKETILYFAPKKLPFGGWTEPVWGDTLANAGYKTFEEAARNRCGG